MFTWLFSTHNTAYYLPFWTPVILKVKHDTKHLAESWSELGEIKTNNRQSSVQ